MARENHAGRNDCSRMTRRRFLAAASGAAGLAALGVGTALTSGCAKPDATTEQPVSFGKRTLGRTGLSLTPFCLGGTGSTSEEVFKAGVDRGINFIHCALGYRSMDRIAPAIAGRRDKLFIGLKYEDLSQRKADYLERSLEEIGVEHVDVLFLPLQSPRAARRPEFRELFEDIKKRGKAHFLGITTHDNIAETMEAAIEVGYFDVLMPSYGPSEKERQALRPVLDKAAEKNLGVVAMKTMVGIAPEKTQHMATALKEVLSDSAVTCVVKGALNLELLDTFLTAVGQKPEAKESAALQQYIASLEGCLCMLCGRCPSCPKGVNICDIMRSFGYYYTQSGDVRLARATYAELNQSERGNLCDNCGECNSKCPYGVKIAQNVQAAHLVLS